MRKPSRVAFGADAANETTAAVTEYLRDLGVEVVLIGALSDESAVTTAAESAGSNRSSQLWPAVGRAVAEAVASRKVDEGVVACWTGTGVSMAANRVRGVRAALCTDAATAEGPRKWNDASVLAIGLRLTTPAVAREMLGTWLATEASREDEDAVCFRMVEG